MIKVPAGRPLPRAVRGVHNETARATLQRRNCSNSSEVTTAEADLKTSAPAKKFNVPYDQVHTFLTTVCEDTSLAEVQVEMGDFQLYVKRATEAAAPTTPAPPAPAAAAPLAPAVAPGPAFESAEDSGDEMDEAHIYVSSPKVGIFRRGNYVKGRQVGSQPLVELGSEVKKGQKIGFVEQLGSVVPVEAPQAGEVTAFKVVEGDAVEYKQVLMEIAPFFGGHIIGDSKYA